MGQGKARKSRKSKLVSGIRFFVIFRKDKLFLSLNRVIDIWKKISM